MAKLSLPFESKYLPLKKFLDVYHRSMEEPEEFWAEQARQLDWFKTWDKVLEWKLGQGAGMEAAICPLVRWRAIERFLYMHRPPR